MAIEYNLDDMQKKSRGKKFKRFLKKVIAVVIIVAVGVCAYIFRDRWIPLFEGIGTRYSNAVKNSGELAEGNFPIEIGDDAGYQLNVTDSYLTYLDDTHFYIYSTDGEQVADRQHEYSAPVLKTGGKRAIVYDSGGKIFSVESKQKTVYEKVTDGNIILARLSASDMAAVVTEADGFACVMNVYNSDGSNLYTLKNVEGRISEVAFKTGSTGCIVSNVDVKGGELVSTLSSYNFSKAEADWQSDTVDTLIFSVNIMGDGTITAFGDTKCAYYSADGKLTGTYEYPDTLLDYSGGNGISAMLFQKEELRKSALVTITDINTPVITQLEEPAKSVYADANGVYVLTQSKLSLYSPEGILLDSVGVSDDYIGFVKIGGYIYLEGYSEINRIDFES